MSNSAIVGMCLGLTLGLTACGATAADEIDGDASARSEDSGSSDTGPTGYAAVEAAWELM